MRIWSGCPRVHPWSWCPGGACGAHPDRAFHGCRQKSLGNRTGLGGGRAFAPGLHPHLAAAYRRGRGEKALPLLGYTAVACRDGAFYAAARLTEDPCRWDPVHYNTKELPALVRKKRAEYPQNRILRQLARCSLEYQCFTAQNIFYGRWEGRHTCFSFL